MMDSNKQQGAVLVSVMVYMLVLSMLGISSMHGTAMEERMVSNEWEHFRAFQAAESVIQDAEVWFLLQPNLIEASADGSNGVWPIGTVIVVGGQWSAGFDWSINGISYGDKSGKSTTLFRDFIKQPKYVVEEAGFEPADNDPDTLAKRTGVFYYRLSALGYGRSAGSRSILQVTLEKHHN
jgi:type IV pilus assembly protein PilX